MMKSEEKTRNRRFRIEICGGIASGKTTLAKLLSSIGVHPILENFSENPFWKAFYSNPGRYIFETEVSFTLQHYHQIMRAQGGSRIDVCDFSFLIDIAYAEIGLRGSKLETYMYVCREIKRDIPPPVLVVHLMCDANIELDRIRKRNRYVEKSITSEYLVSLNRAVAEQVNLIIGKTEVLTLDSGKNNFASDRLVRQNTRQLIKETLLDCGVPDDLLESVKS